MRPAETDQNLATYSLVGVGETNRLKSKRKSAGGDSDPNFENFDLYHVQSPDTGRGVHARSWWANRGVDARR